MRRIQTSVSIFCRKYTLPCGAVSKATRPVARFVRGSTAWLTNVATSHVIRRRRHVRRFVDLEEVEVALPGEQRELVSDRQMVLEQLLMLIQQLKPLDRQVILAYLEGLDAVSIGEITGLSPSNVATKIHRIKNVLARRFHQGEPHE